MQIEAAVQDAIESRQLLVNMHRGGTGAIDFDEEEDHKDGALDEELGNEGDGEGPVNQSQANASSRRPTTLVEGHDTMGSYRVGMPQTGSRRAAMERTGLMSSAHGQTSRRGAGSFMSRGGSTRSTTSSSALPASHFVGDQQYDARAQHFGEQAAVLQDVISMQVATLQERTDKVYTMLTTKLGRVR